MSRTLRSGLSYLTALSTTAVTMVVGFIALPYLLGWLGEERYGAFRAASDWLAHLSLLELGLGGASLPLLARAIAGRSKNDIRDSLAATVRAYGYVTAPMLAAGIALALLAPRVIPVDPAMRGDLQLGLLIAVGGMLLVPLRPFQSFWQAHQRGYRVNAILLLQSLVITGTAVYLAWRGWGIKGQLLAVVVGSLVFFGLLTRGVLRRYPGVLARAVRPEVRGPPWRDLWKLNTPTLFRDMAARVSVLSDRIIVAALLGPAMVVPLYVTQRLAELAQMQLQSLGTATWAGLAELYAQEKIGLFNRRVVELTRLVAVLGVAGLVPVVAYNGHFVTRWVGADRYAGELVTVVAGLVALMLAITTLWDWCFSGTGKVAMLVPLSATSMVLNVTLSIVLTPILGVVGPLLGTLAAGTLTTAWYLPVMMRRTFGASTSALLGAAIVPVGWGIAYGSALMWITRSHTPPGWMALGGEMIGAAGAFLAFWWLLGLSSGDRAEVMDRLRAAVGALRSR